MADPPGEVQAAGAVVWRPAAGGEVALIHRSRYDDWSFPKGKCEPGEHVLAAAVREVAEETGVRVILGRPLGTTRYDSGGQHKRVSYWAGHSREPLSGFVPNAEVDRLEWLPIPAALGRLSYQRDVRVLTRFAGGPAQTVPCILLRHATAGSKSDWQGNDLARPLDSRGTAAAESLAQLLSCFGPCRVITSAAERCVATVRPYAALIGAQIELEPLFTVRRKGRGRAADDRAFAGQAAAAPAGADRAAADLAAADRAASIAADGRPVVICAHRENLPLLLDAACSGLRSGWPGSPMLPKGGFWVLHSSAGTLVSAERHHPARE
jgi:8-oxo-(d)GTP phosphatase